MAQISIFEDPCHGLSPGLRVTRTYEQSGITRYLGQRRSIRADDRRSAGHGFQYRHAKPFIEGRERKEGTTGIEHAQVLERHMARKDCSRLEPGSADGRLDRFPTAFHPADHDEVQPLPQSGCTTEGLDQADNVFARLRSAAGEHKRLASDSIARLGCSLHGWVMDRVELLAHSGIHNGDPLPRHTI